MVGAASIGQRMDGPPAIPETTRDNVQAQLIGPPATREPGHRLHSGGRSRLISPGMGTPNLLDNAVVRHVSGGISTVGFQAAKAARKWQGQ